VKEKAICACNAAKNQVDTTLKIRQLFPQKCGIFPHPCQLFPQMWGIIPYRCQLLLNSFQIRAAWRRNMYSRGRKPSVTILITIPNPVRGGMLFKHSLRLTTPHPALSPQAGRGRKFWGCLLHGVARCLPRATNIPRRWRSVWWENYFINSLFIVYNSRAALPSPYAI